MVMNWIDLTKRILKGEDAHTEFKSVFGDTVTISKVICAFANGDGGILVFGVNDSGDIVGVKDDPKKVQEKLTKILHNGCGQPVTADSGCELTDDGWVHWVEVQPHHRGYEPFKVNNRYYIRRGRSTVAPSPSELQDLFNVFGLVLTEEQIIPTATVDDIDFEVFFSFLRLQGKKIDEEPQPDVESDLENTFACQKRDQKLRPTLFGLMVFGRYPQNHRHTISHYIQCAAYAGTDQAAEVLSVSEGKGRLDEQVTRSIDWFRSLGRKELYRGLYRTDIPLVPEEALREALVNAVIHRDYAIRGAPILFEIFDDHIDVTSPGALPNHLKVEQVRSGGFPRSRNEMMANAMVVKRLMERRGRGWLLMRNVMRSFNGTEPELIHNKEGRTVRVRFHFDSDADDGSG